MINRFKTALLLVLMLLAAGGAYGLRPTQKIADSAPPVDLEAMIPKAFGDWKEEPQRMTQIVDPQQQQTIDRIYNKTLSRTYVNADGYRVMLSIAYGSNQNDSMQVHKPEFCYPAQGFLLHETRAGILSTTNGNIPVTRIRTSLGARHEPVTYWTTVGDRAVAGGVQKKIVEMGYGITGRIPDGMLVRVSSISPDSDQAFIVQQEFVSQLLFAAGAKNRARLAGFAS